MGEGGKESKTEGQEENTVENTQKDNRGETVEEITGKVITDVGKACTYLEENIGGLRDPEIRKELKGKIHSLGFYENFLFRTQQVFSLKDSNDFAGFYKATKSRQADLKEAICSLLKSAEVSARNSESIFTTELLRLSVLYLLSVFCYHLGTSETPWGEDIKKIKKALDAQKDDPKKVEARNWAELFSNGVAYLSIKSPESIAEKFAKKCFSFLKSPLGFLKDWNAHANEFQAIFGNIKDGPKFLKIFLLNISRIQMMDQKLNPDNRFRKEILRRMQNLGWQKTNEDTLFFSTTKILASLASPTVLYLKNERILPERIEFLEKHEIIRRYDQNGWLVDLIIMESYKNEEEIAEFREEVKRAVDVGTVEIFLAGLNEEPGFLGVFKNTEDQTSNISYIDPRGGDFFSDFELQSLKLRRNAEYMSSFLTNAITDNCALLRNASEEMKAFEESVTTVSTFEGLSTEVSTLEKRLGKIKESYHSLSLLGYLDYNLQICQDLCAGIYAIVLKTLPEGVKQESIDNYLNLQNTWEIYSKIQSVSKKDEKKKQEFGLFLPFYDECYEVLSKKITVCRPSEFWKKEEIDRDDIMEAIEEKACKTPSSPKSYIGLCREMKLFSLKFLGLRHWYNNKFEKNKNTVRDNIEKLIKALGGFHKGCKAKSIEESRKFLRNEICNFKPPCDLETNLRVWIETIDDIFPGEIPTQKYLGDLKGQSWEKREEFESTWAEVLTNSSRKTFESLEEIEFKSETGKRIVHLETLFGLYFTLPEFAAKPRSMIETYVLERNIQETNFSIRCLLESFLVHKEAKEGLGKTSRIHREYLKEVVQKGIKEIEILLTNAEDTQEPWIKSPLVAQIEKLEKRYRNQLFNLTKLELRLNVDFGLTAMRAQLVRINKKVIQIQNDVNDIKFDVKEVLWELKGMRGSEYKLRGVSFSEQIKKVFGRFSDQHRRLYKDFVQPKIQIFKTKRQDEILKSMRENQITVIFGGAGCGKSIIAKLCAVKCFDEEYAAVFWIDARSVATISKSLEQYGFDPQSNPNTLLKEIFSHYYSKCDKRSLFVFDNVEPDLLKILEIAKTLKSDKKDCQAQSCRLILTTKRKENLIEGVEYSDVSDNGELILNKVLQLDFSTTRSLSAKKHYTNSLLISLVRGLTVLTDTLTGAKEEEGSTQGFYSICVTLENEVNLPSYTTPPTYARQLEVIRRMMKLLKKEREPYYQEFLKAVAMLQEDTISEDWIKQFCDLKKIDPFDRKIMISELRGASLIERKHIDNFNMQPLIKRLIQIEYCKSAEDRWKYAYLAYKIKMMETFWSDEDFRESLNRYIDLSYGWESADKKDANLIKVVQRQIGHNSISVTPGLTILTGNSGDGKSLFLRKFALDHFEKEASPYVFFIDLPKIDVDAEGGIQKHLQNMLGLSANDIEDFKKDQTSSQGQGELKRGCFFLLDSYDEIPSSGGVYAKDINDTWKMDEWQNSHVLLTCRTQIYEEIKRQGSEFSRWTERQIPSIGKDWIDNYIKKFLEVAGWDPFEEPSVINREKEAILKKIGHIKPMLQNPFMIRMFMDSWESLKDDLGQIGSVYDIYDAFLRSWFDRQLLKLSSAIQEMVFENSLTRDRMFNECVEFWFSMLDYMEEDIIKTDKVLEENELQNSLEKLNATKEKKKMLKEEYDKNSKEIKEEEKEKYNKELEKNEEEEKKFQETYDTALKNKEKKSYLLKTAPFRINPEKNEATFIHPELAQYFREVKNFQGARNLNFEKEGPFCPILASFEGEGKANFEKIRDKFLELNSNSNSKPKRTFSGAEEVEEEYFIKFEEESPKALSPSLSRFDIGLNIQTIATSGSFFCMAAKDDNKWQLRDREGSLCDVSHPNRHDGTISVIAVSKESLVATGDSEGGIVFWEISENTPTIRFLKSSKSIKLEDDSITAMCFSKNSCLIIGTRKGSLVEYSFEKTPETGIEVTNSTLRENGRPLTQIMIRDSGECIVGNSTGNYSRFSREGTKEWKECDLQITHPESRMVLTNSDIVITYAETSEKENQVRVWSLMSSAVSEKYQSLKKTLKGRISLIQVLTENKILVFFNNAIKGSKFGIWEYDQETKWKQTSGSRVFYGLQLRQGIYSEENETYVIADNKGTLCYYKKDVKAQTKRQLFIQILDICSNEPKKESKIPSYVTACLIPLAETLLLNCQPVYADKLCKIIRRQDQDSNHPTLFDCLALPIKLSAEIANDIMDKIWTCLKEIIDRGNEKRLETDKNEATSNGHGEDNVSTNNNEDCNGKTDMSNNDSKDSANGSDNNKSPIEGSNKIEARNLKLDTLVQEVSNKLISDYDVPEHFLFTFKNLLAQAIIKNEDDWAENTDVTIHSLTKRRILNMWLVERYSYTPPTFSIILHEINLQEYESYYSEGLDIKLKGKVDILGIYKESQLLQTLLRGSEIETISFKGIALDCEGVTALAEALKDSRSILEALDLQKCNLGNDGAEIILTLLGEKHENLRILNLEDNGITQKSEIEKLAKVLKINPKLEELNISQNKFGDHGSIFLKALDDRKENKMEDLEFIYISGCGLSPDDKEQIRLRKSRKDQSTTVEPSQVPKRLFT